MLGLAVGDALGAPVEFLTLNEIRQKFGPSGVTDLHPWGGFPAGYYTDDTQMSLATAEGCIRAHQRWRDRGLCDPASVIYERYLDWHRSQSVPAMRRGPGNTCLSALASGNMGSMRQHINNSKGCGGVMRTAPAGLALNAEDAFKWGAEFAAITHGHPSGYLSAGALSAVISYLIEGKVLSEAIDLALQILRHYPGHDETLNAITSAVELSHAEVQADEALRSLGEGWVGEEALAIALYSSLKHQDDWAAGVLTAVNHSGDSDSTGSIAGGILGAILVKTQFRSTGS
jgi:ADP-ribosylglycohydrolase